MAATEKLQKLLARAGLGSRRELEAWIRAGRIQVNGRVACIGARVSGREAIAIDGRRVDLSCHRPQRTRVLLYNKPAGEICSRHDPEGRRTVFTKLPALNAGRWMSVGRLDMNSQGLLLFTNDGDLLHRLAHPSANIDREYAVRLLGEVTGEMMSRLKSGVFLEDGMARCTDVRFYGGEGANRWYHITIMEGRNREVHRLWESQGIRVSRLKRVRFGPVVLPSILPQGRWLELHQGEVAAICDLVHLDGRFDGRARPAVTKHLLRSSRVLIPYQGLAGFRRHRGLPAEITRDPSA